jgi:hypothetical protein
MIASPCAHRGAVGLAAFARLTALLVGGALCACGDAGAGRSDAPVAQLLGRVRLAPGAVLPAYAPFDLAGRVLQPRAARALPKECAAALEDARQPVRADSEGLLAGVVIAASDFARFRPRAPKKHVVAISGCHLQPAVIAATQNDQLWVENHDAFDFAPLLGPTYRAQPLGKGRSAQFPLQPGVDSVLCDRSAPCGRADVVVFQHPVHAVSGAHGEFRIDAFPAGELVRVTAWHPLFEESETFVWLEPGKPLRVELLLVPKQRFVDAHSAKR